MARKRNKSIVFTGWTGNRIGDPRAVSIGYSRLRLWLRPSNDNQPQWRQWLGRLSPVISAALIGVVIWLLLI